MVHVKTAKFIMLSYLTVGLCENSGVTIVIKSLCVYHEITMKKSILHSLLKLNFATNRPKFLKFCTKLGHP